MAFRYRQRTPQPRDIVDPEDFNENAREIISEFNGRLDRDNIRERSIETTMITTETFNVVRSNQLFSKVLSKNSQEYKTVNTVEFELKYSGVAICEWSGEWEFSEVVMGVNPTDANIIDVGIYVNGVEACRLFRSSDSATIDCGYIVGAMAFSSGRVNIEARARIRKVIGQSEFVNCTGDVTLRNCQLIVTARIR